MALETGSFIDDLVVTNPLGTDAKNKGDDHLQLVKKVVKATFPGMVGAAWRVQAKTGTYTVVAGDNMSVLNCTTALTLNLTAAATLGNQHMFLVIANGGAVTIDPNGAETINGSATLVVADGSSAFVVCNGTLFLAAVAEANESSAFDNLVEDTTPQLGGQLDVNGNALGDGTLELLDFVETASAVNHVKITNAATGNAPLIDAAGDDAGIPLNLRGKGSSKVQLGDADLQWPDADGSANDVLQTDGSGVLSFTTPSAGPSQATQAAIEAETNQNTYLPPDLVKKSPGIAKQWVKFEITGGVNKSYNTSSVTDTGTGIWTINIGTNMSSVDYSVSVSWRDNSANGDDIIALAGAQAAGTYQLLTFDISGAALTDPGSADDMHGQAFGDQ